MAYTKDGHRVGYDNIAVGSVTGRENIVAVGAVDHPGIGPLPVNESPNSAVTATLSRSSQTVTATATAHGLAVGQVVIMRGANQEEYNGEFVVLTTADADTFTYAIPAGTPTATATGTIECVGRTQGRPIAGDWNPQPELVSD